MDYCICTICNSVVEGRGSNVHWRIREHIKEVHLDIIEQIEKDEEREREERAKVHIKAAIGLHDFYVSETLPQKEGRREHEGNIIKFN